MINISTQLQAILNTIKALRVPVDVLTNTTASDAFQRILQPLESNPDPNNLGLKQIFDQANAEIKQRTDFINSLDHPPDPQLLVDLSPFLFAAWASFQANSYLTQLSANMGYPAPAAEFYAPTIPLLNIQTHPSPLGVVFPGPPVFAPPPANSGGPPAPPVIIPAPPPLISPPTPNPPPTPVPPGVLFHYLSAQQNLYSGSGEPGTATALAGNLGVNTVKVPLYFITPNSTSVTAAWMNTNNDPTIVGGRVDLIIDAYKSAGLKVILSMEMIIGDNTPNTQFFPSNTITFLSILSTLAVQLAKAATRKNIAAISIAPGVFPSSNNGDSPSQYMAQWRNLYTACKSSFTGDVLYFANPANVGPIGMNTSFDWTNAFDAIGVSVRPDIGTASSVTSITSLWESGNDLTTNYSKPIFGATGWLRTLYQAWSSSGRKIFLETGIAAKSTIAAIATTVTAAALPSITIAPRPVRAPVPNAVSGVWINGTDQGNYWYLLPHGYDPQNNLYPVVLFLHTGQNGSQIPNGNTPLKWLNDSFFRTNYPAIIVAPVLDQTGDTTNTIINFGGYSSAVQAGQTSAIALVNQFITRFAVDPNRVYVTGTGMGGLGAWDMIIKYNSQTGTNGRIFAAGMPFAGAIYYLDTFPSVGFVPDSTVIANLQNVPIWAIHSSGDPTISPNWDIGMFAAQQNIFGRMKLTLLPVAHHDCWDPGMIPNWSGYQEAEPLYDWMFTQASNFSVLLPQESPNNTIINNAGQTLINSANEAFTLMAGQVAINGVTDPTSSNAVQLYYFAHLVYYKNSIGTWFSRLRASDLWANANDPSILAGIGTTSSAGTRQYVDQPGGNNSAWNTPFGDGCLWGDASDADTQDLRHAGLITTINNNGIVVWVSTSPTDPSTTFTGINPNYATAADGIGTALSVTANLVPASYSPGPFSVAVPLANTQIYNFIDTTNHPGFYYAVGPIEIDSFASGQGPFSGINVEILDAMADNFAEDQELGIAGLCSAVGVIRAYDVDPLRNPNYPHIQHGLSYGTSFNYLRDNTITGNNGLLKPDSWPRAYQDLQTAARFYTGNLKTGTTVGIPINQIMPSGLSDAGKAIFWNLQHYPCMWRPSQQLGFGLAVDQNVPLAWVNAANIDLPTILQFVCPLRNQHKGGISFALSPKNGPGTRLDTGPPPLIPLG